MVPVTSHLLQTTPHLELRNVLLESVEASMLYNIPADDLVPFGFS